MNLWEVIVSGIGKVHENHGDERLARHRYERYVYLSKQRKIGEFAGRTVSLWRDNEPLEEHDPNSFLWDDGTVHDNSQRQWKIAASQ
jgi:hypothetical protein